MFYLIGIIKSAFLYGIILLPICVFKLDLDIQTILEYGLNFENNNLINLFCSYMLISVIAYPITVVLHLLACKIDKINDSLLEIYFRGLGSDIISPFRRIFIFLLVITKNHEIDDDSAWHNFVDFVQIIFGFICALLLLSFIILSIFNLYS